MKRALLFLCLLDAAALADEPLKLEDAVNPPAWFTFQGETRIRYETLDGQFRAGRQGSDQLLLFRTLMLAEAHAGPVSIGLELQDSRTYLADAGTPLSTSLVNPLDVLQFYLRADDLPGLIGSGSSAEVILGRQTVSIGSRRQIERVDFANVIFSYTGAHLISRNPRGDALHLLYVVPTARFPNTRPALDDNELSGDEEQWGRQIWGVHAIRANLAGDMAPGLSGEAFVYGLEERDTRRFQTPDRSYVTVGGRLYRAPQPGQWDIDVEAARRKGTRYATSSPADTQSLSVEAEMLFAALGYSLEMAWRPRLALEYYYASGDGNPDDLAFDQYERLFGSRRTDLNNTSIHGPLTPANISAPGLRLEVRPDARWDGWAQYHAVSLASSTDAWVIAGLRDPDGQSGRFVGHAFDTRARYWVIPESLRLELGASVLIFGEFAKSVPGGPNGDRTLFGYSQLTLSF
ncbi:alginate export family protein [Hyphomonas sp.]|uniref:alginate export family protein n=1 Tax=Hyphomonas sp. TaxID=87 RepID=UPI00391A7671